MINDNYINITAQKILIMIKTLAFIAIEINEQQKRLSLQGNLGWQLNRKQKIFTVTRK